MRFKSYTCLLGLIFLAGPIQASDLDIETDLINSPGHDVLEVPMGASTGDWSKGKGKGGDPVWTGADPGQVYVNPGQTVNPGQVYVNPGQTVNPGQQFDPGQHSTGLIFADPTVRQPESAPQAPHTYHDHQSSWRQPTHRYNDYYYNNGSQGSWYWNGNGWSFQYSWSWNTQPRYDHWTNYNHYNWNHNQYSRWQREQLRQLDRRTDRVRDRLRTLHNRYPRGSYYRAYFAAARQQGEELLRLAKRGDYYSQQQLSWWLSSWENYLGMGNYYYGQTYAYRY